MGFGYAQAVALHAVVGAVALGLFWLALARVKGSDAHRRDGRRFLVSMLVTVAAVAPVVLLRVERFDPGIAVMLVYLSVCVGTVVMLAWTAVRWKDAPERFRGAHLRVLGGVLFVLGAVVLAAGIVHRDPVPVVLSWVGLANGAAMLRFAYARAPLHPRWWLAWHLNAVWVLSTAVHGTLAFVAWRWAFVPDASRADAAAWHAVALASALAARVWWGRRRQLPWLGLQSTSAPSAARQAT